MKTILAFTKTTIKTNTSYRGAIFIWMISTVISVGVAVFLWLSSENNTLGGYTKPELISYYLVLLIVKEVATWTPFTPIAREIQTGEVLSYLIKPLSFLRAWFGREIGFKIISITIFSSAWLLLFATLLVLKVPLYLTLNWKLIFLAIAIPGSIAISFLFSFCLALLGFWFTEVRYLSYLYWTIFPFLGGLALPTSFLPPSLQKINIFLPFRYQLSLPLEIIFHRLDLVGIIISILIMSFWIVFLTKLYRFMWKNGIKTYAAFGH